MLYIDNDSEWSLWKTLPRCSWHHGQAQINKFLLRSINSTRYGSCWSVVFKTVNGRDGQPKLPPHLLYTTHVRWLYACGLITLLLAIALYTCNNETRCRPPAASPDPYASVWLGALTKTCKPPSEMHSGDTKFWPENYRVRTFFTVSLLLSTV